MAASVVLPALNLTRALQQASTKRNISRRGPPPIPGGLDPLAICRSRFPDIAGEREATKRLESCRIAAIQTASSMRCTPAAA